MDQWELLVLQVLPVSCLFYHRSCCSRGTILPKDALDVIPEELSTIFRIVTSELQRKI